MATTRSAGYVVTAAVWNAVLSRLTDDGVTFSGNVNGGSIAGTTGSFSSTLAVTGAVTLSSTLAASGVATFSAGANRAVVIDRSGTSDVGLQIANDTRTYGIAIDSGGSHRLVIQEDADGSPRVQVDAANNQIGFAATAGVTNANYYNSATEQPGFLAYNSANDTGVTNNTTIDFNTEEYDTGSDFASDTFTAPVAGKYEFTGCVSITDTSGGTANPIIALYVNGTTYYYCAGYSSVTTGATIRIPIAATLNLAANDTVVVKYLGTSQCTILGDASIRLTWFSGRLLV